MAIINKPIESKKTIRPEPSSFTGNDFKEPAPINKGPEPASDDCRFRGMIRRASNHGNDFFNASSELHQKHDRNFTCLDVLMMEKQSGRHKPGCSHVGFWSSKACCVKDKS